jgi:hypothetical protein
MTIGLIFPVTGHESIKGVPWGLVEPHRQTALRNHGLPLERLAALGGLPIEDVLRIVLRVDRGTALPSEEIKAFEQRHSPKAGKGA